MSLVNIEVLELLQKESYKFSGRSRLKAFKERSLAVFEGRKRLEGSGKKVVFSNQLTDLSIMYIFKMVEKKRNYSFYKRVLH